MHSVSGSGIDPHVEVCVCMRSLQSEPMDLPFLRLLADLKERLLGLQWVSSPEHRSEGKLYIMGKKDLFRRLLWPKMLGWTCADPEQVQVCLPPHKPFFIPLASCLPSVSPLPIISWVSNSFSASLPTKALLFLITWWLRWAKLLTFSSPPCEILLSSPVAQENPKAGGGGAAQQSHSALAQL